MAWSRSRAWAYGPALAYAGLLFWLSHQTRLPTGPVTNDKVVHIIAYLGLGFLTSRAAAWNSARSRLRVVTWGTVLSALYGVSDEWHQSFVPGRDASSGDMWADAFGAILGAGLWGGLGVLRAWFTARGGHATSAECSHESDPF